MRVIKPAAITDARFVSCTTPETDYADWLVGTTYAAGDRRQYLHRVWLSLQAANVGHAPDEINSLWWVDTGPTNQRAQFDNEVNTVTSGTGTLTTVIKPGAVNAVALLGLKGKTVEVTIRRGLAGEIVYFKSAKLNGTVITNLYEYRYEPKVGLSEVILLNLPPYADAHITVSVIGANPATSPVECGAFICGATYTLGDVEYGATAGIIDYSKIETDEFGTTTFVKRNFSKRINVNMSLENGRMNKVQRILADLRATPCVWVGVETPGYEPLNVFGFYSEFLITVAYPTHSSCSLEIKGMI